MYLRISTCTAAFVCIFLWNPVVGEEVGFGISSSQFGSSSLFRIDLSSGNATKVGELSPQLNGINAIEHVTPSELLAAVGTELYSINLLDATTSFLGTVNNIGIGVQSLAFDGETLFADTVTNFLETATLSTIDADTLVATAEGEVQADTWLPPGPNNVVDVDGLAVSPGGMLVGADGGGPFSVSNSTLFQITVTNGTVDSDFLGQIPNKLIVAMDFAGDSTLYATTFPTNFPFPGTPAELLTIDLTIPVSITSSMTVNGLESGGYISAFAIVDMMVGDFDMDGDVDGGDFLHWQRDDTTASSLVVWEQNYGVTTLPLASAATAVPEPPSVALVVLGTCMLLRWLSLSRF